MKLRDYQERAVSAIREQWAGGDLDALLVLATGLGKTATASTIAHQVRREHRCRVLWLAHRIELVNQAARRLSAMADDATVGIYRASQRDTAADVICASVQSCTAERMLELPLADFGLVVVDEAHHVAPGSAYDRVISAVRERRPGALHLGLTATPYRADRVGLGHFYPRETYRMSILDGIEAGYLAPLDLRAIEVDLDYDGIDLRTDSAGADQVGELLDQPNVRDTIIAKWRELAGARPTVMFCESVAQSAHLADALTAAGVTARAVWGGMPKRERVAALQAYESGEVQVLTNCNVLTEGWDAPHTACVVLARRVCTPSVLVQTIGRGTRLAEGKADCLVLDCMGSHSRVGGLLHGADLSTRTPGNDEASDKATDPQPERWPEEVGRVQIKGVRVLQLDVFGGAVYWYRLRPGVRVCSLGGGRALVVSTRVSGDASAFVARGWNEIRCIAEGPELDTLRAAEVYARENGDGRWMRPNRWLASKLTTSAGFVRSAVAAAERLGVCPRGVPDPDRMTIVDQRAWSAYLGARIAWARSRASAA